MYNNNQSDDRQWFEGNWKCGVCGAEITKLPFQPDPARLDSLKCRDCHKKDLASRPPRSFGGGRR